MSVPSLEDIAVNTSIRYIWENSVLQSNIIEQVFANIERANTEAETVIINSLPFTWSVYNDDHKNEINTTLHAMLEKMMTSKCLPHPLRVRWVIAFECIYEELKDCAFEICRRLMRLNQCRDMEMVKFCINRIILTQAGLIDKSKTILKVLRDSQFHIKLDPVYVARNVEEKTLCNLAKQVLDEIDDRGAKMPRLEHDTRRTIALTLESYSSSISVRHRNIESAVEHARQEDFRHHYAGKLALLAELGELSAVSQYIDQQRQLSPDSLQEQIEQAARFLIYQISSNLEMIVFLFDNMDQRHLVEVLNKSFEFIFKQFLKSRRYRSLCLRLFRYVAQTINPDTFENVFRDANLAWFKTKYDYYDIMQILQSIWLEAPDRLKQNELFNFIIIPEMFSAHYDVDMLTFFLNSYNLDRQKHFLAQIIICLFKNNKEDIIVECLKAAPQLGLNLDNYKTIIDTEFMKKHLLQQWCVGFLHGGKNYEYHLKLLESIYHGNINTFKRELLKDRDFIKNYLHEHRLAHMDEVLSWCYNEDETSIKKFTSQLLADGFIQNAYENVLIGGEQIPCVDYSLKTLQLSEREIVSLKNNIMNIPKVKKAMLDRILKENNLRMGLIKSEFSFYFSEGQEQESMERLFLCEEARDAILALLIPSLSSLEEDPCLRRPVSMFLEDFSDKVKVLFEPYSLKNRIDKMLDEYGHPNLRTEKIYPIEALFGVSNAREMSMARKLVDCNYRCVRALLRRNFTEEELCEAERRDVTELSLGLAAKAALDVPVVL